MVKVSDAQLHRLAQAELDWEPGLIGQKIGLLVSDGVVTLCGWVDSGEKKRVAEAAVKRVSGVLAIAEELGVRCAGPTPGHDTDIARAIARYLRSQTPVLEGTVVVLVEAGWATLEGEVELPSHRMSVEKDLRQLGGVRGVTNLIAVKAK